MSFVKVKADSGYRFSKPTLVWLNTRYITDVSLERLEGGKKRLKVYYSPGTNHYVYLTGRNAQLVIDAMEAQI